ncbi:MAG: hypothetical protein J6N45_07655 [Alphaproteobacteria bacterium]|nr:hypothetical protein [Alphaproteobacteria bacterium]
MANNNITFQLGQRWAGLLRRHFASAKQVARAFDVEVKTANSWLSGATPYAKYIQIAAEKLGSEFVAELFCLNKRIKTIANIDDELIKMEKSLSNLRQEIRNLEQGNND